MADVVIIGAGIAGLVAGNHAAELGCRVVVLEAGTGDDYACNTRIATGAMNFAHSNPQLPPDELVAAIAADTEGHADPALARKLAETAGRGLQFLMDNGAEFIRKELQNKLSWMLAPPRALKPGLDWQDRGADRMLKQLAARLAERGGTLRTGARATELITQDGRVCGVVVNGTERIAARCVVLADGGFQGNGDMVRRFICPRPEALVQRSAGSSHGDCIRMAEALGAKLIDMEWFYGHLLSRAAFDTPNLWPYPGLDSLTNGSILVDAGGRRIFDEGSGGILLSNLISRLDDPTGTWIVFDEEIWTTTGRDEVVPANPHLPDAGGIVLSAPTLAELAAKMGMDAGALGATVAEYNAAVTAGRPETLVPPRSPGRRFGVIRNDPRRIPVRPVHQAPFYAAPLSVGISCTLGGVAIDPAGRVKRVDGGTIPGLFAAGSTSGGIEGGPAAGYIGGLALSYCTALMAAEGCAAEIAAARV